VRTVRPGGALLRHQLAAPDPPGGRPGEPLGERERRGSDLTPATVDGKCVPAVLDLDDLPVTPSLWLWCLYEALATAARRSAGGARLSGRVGEEIPGGFQRLRGSPGQVG
jgi:hypothetical protein